MFCECDTSEKFTTGFTSNFYKYLNYQVMQKIYSLRERKILIESIVKFQYGNHKMDPSHFKLKYHVDL